jgi:hypothetical protein
MRATRGTDPVVRHRGSTTGASYPCWPSMIWPTLIRRPYSDSRSRVGRRGPRRHRRPDLSSRDGKRPATMSAMNPGTRNGTKLSSHRIWSAARVTCGAHSRCAGLVEFLLAIRDSLAARPGRALARMIAEQLVVPGTPDVAYGLGRQLAAAGEHRTQRQRGRRKVSKNVYQIIWPASLRSWWLRGGEDCWSGLSTELGMCSYSRWPASRQCW